MQPGKQQHDRRTAHGQRQAAAQQAFGAKAARQTGKDHRGDDQPDTVQTEQQTELHGAHAVFALHHEGRRADVGEQPGHHKGLDQAEAQKAAIFQHRLAALLAGGMRCCGRARFPQDRQAHHQQHAADGGHRPEENSPVEGGDNVAAQHRGQHRRNAVHGHQQGEKLGQQGALVFIAGDGSRQHRAAGAGEAL